MRSIDHAVAAIKFNRPDLLALFIPHLDLSEIPTGEFGTLIDLACYHNHWECASLMIKNLNKDTHQNVNCNAALVYSVAANNLQMTHSLLRAGAGTVGGFLDNHNTVMHEAVTNNNAEMVELLLSYGVAINSKNKNEETPFDMVSLPLGQGNKCLEKGWLNYLERETQNYLLVLLIAASHQKTTNISKLSDPILNLIFTFLTPPRLVPNNKDLMAHGKDILKQTLPKWYRQSLFKSPHLPSIAQTSEIVKGKRKKESTKSSYNLRNKR